MNMIPFGEVVQERVEEAVKYGLIEMVAGIWRITAKARKHYEPASYMRYLQGKITTQEVEKIKATEKKDPKFTTRNNPQPKMDQKAQLVQEILAM